MTLLNTTDKEGLVKKYQRSRKTNLKTLILLVLFFSFAFPEFMEGFFNFSSVQAQATSGTADLSWNANSESDLAGYKIYYGTGSRIKDCPETNNGGYNGANIPIIVDKNQTNYHLDNLPAEFEYYFSLTAFDTSGNESCFSNEASKAIPELLTCDQLGKSVQPDTGGDVFNLLDVTAYEHNLLTGQAPAPDINGDGFSNHTDFISLMQCISCRWNYNCFQ